MAQKSVPEKPTSINEVKEHKTPSINPITNIPAKDTRQKSGRGVLLVLSMIVLLLIGAAGYLLSWDKRTTVIELIATVSSLEFRSAIDPGHQIPLVSNLDLDSIDLPQFKSAVFYSTTSTNPSDYKTDEPDGLGGRLTRDGDDDFIGIDELLMPANSKVELKRLDETDNKYQLALIGEALSLTIQTQGTPTFLITGLVDPKDSSRLISESLDWDAGKGTDIDFVPVTSPPEKQEELVMNFVPRLTDSQRISLAANDKEPLSLEINSSQEIVFGEQLEVSHLVLSRINDSLKSPDGTSVPRPVSAIESGTLYLEDLNGKEVPLRPGEQLEFEVSEGIIRKLSLQDGLINIQFRGTVEGMRSGFEESRSLMPSWIEYLLAREAWLAVLGGVGTILGLFFAYLQGRGAMKS